jgi:serine/threonine protein kinase
MGTVFLCRDINMDRIVAVKLMRKDLSSARGQERKRFLREAYTTARLQHPGIPPVFHVDTSEEGQLFYAMKLIEGYSLDEILKKLTLDDAEFKEKYPLHRLIEILRDVCQTLEYTHHQNFIHRDLKPSNIFVGDYGEVYIIDWGLTKKLGVQFEEEYSEETTVVSEIEITNPDEDIRPDLLIEEDVNNQNDLTIPGDVLGTPAYMAPEQTSKDISSVSFPADIYAMGVILYRVLTLKAPFRIKSLKELVKVKRESRIPKPEDVSPSRDIPPELSAIALQAMSVEPEDRYKTIKSFGESLEFWLEGRTQFRPLQIEEFSPENIIFATSETKDRWRIEPHSIKSTSRGKGQESIIYLKEPFYGDIRLSFRLRLLHNNLKENPEKVKRFGIFFKASDPNDKNRYDHYGVFFGSNDNSRMILVRNGTVLGSNEHVILETNKKYNVSIECYRGEIRVRLNEYVVLNIIDRSPLAGAWVGFVHHGQPVLYSQFKVETRGLPLKTDTIQIPESLMAEGCYEGARRGFMDVYRNHRNRWVGQWAAYRAGIAIFRGNQSIDDAKSIWEHFQGTQYALLENLGMARIELLRNQPLNAVEQLEQILHGEAPLVLTKALGDFVQEHIQALLVNDEKGFVEWAATDRWIRLALETDQKLARHDSVTVSLFWQWIVRTVKRYPERLQDVVNFIHQTFGKGKGEFKETITNQEQLYLLFKRSLAMHHHPFLIDKLMRLVLWHEDPILDLETLGRFYLNSGHVKVALQIFQQLTKLCIQSDRAVPPSPIAYVACYHWVHDDFKKAKKAFQVMQHHGERWAPSDAQFFLGLEDYRTKIGLNAVQMWMEIKNNAKRKNDIRTLIADGLLGNSPIFHNEAGIPDRADFQFLYSMFIGFRTMIDWENHQQEQDRQKAIALFQEMYRLMKPSYDIYASCELFARLPLEKLGVHLPEMEKAHVLNEEEKDWIKKLIFSVGHELDPFL